MRKLKLSAMMLATLGSVSACATSSPSSLPAVPDTSKTSLCLLMEPQRLRPAPAAGVDDPGNRFDTDETLAWGMEHNAKLEGACPRP